MAVMLLSGYNTFPERSHLHEQSPDVGVQIVQEAIRRDAFENVLACMHLAGKDKDAKVEVAQDRWWKLRPMFNVINETSKAYHPYPASMSVDEMMIKYYGHHRDKQYMKGKPIKFGFKCWGTCDSETGTPWHIEPYCGAHTALPTFNLGQGPDVIAGMVEKTGIVPGTKMFFDNLFTSIPLLKHLTDRGISGTGTMRQNRINSIPIPVKKDLEKLDRGETLEVHSDNVAIIGWKDSRGVYMASNSVANPLDKFTLVRRYNRKDRVTVMVPCPLMVVGYNGGMGGVDLLDRMVSYYVACLRKRKWWWPMWAWFHNVQCVSAWRLFQRVTGKSKKEYGLLKFLRAAVVQTLRRYGTPLPKSGRNKSVNVRGTAADPIRYDGLNHWSSDVLVSRGVCQQCKKRTFYTCIKCNKYVHPLCFRAYHTGQ